MKDLDRLFDTVVGTVTLRAGELSRQAAFYERAIGLEPREAIPGAIDMAAADGSVLVRLDASRSAGAEPVREPHAGLFHTAFRYPDRAALGAAVDRAMHARADFSGASDHGVSEAVYLNDPEGNGIELYRDRAYEEWPPAQPGRVGMFTAPLDVGGVLAAAGEREEVASCDVGHIHLKASDVEEKLRFYRDLVGLDERQRFGREAIFLAEGVYHHHLGANTWQSAGAPPAPPGRPGLESFALRLRSAQAVDEAAARLERAGAALARDAGSISVADPDGTRLVLTSR